MRVNTPDTPTRADTVNSQQALIETLQARLEVEQARRERAESIIHGFEGSMRAIRGRAQAGQMATSPVFIAELFESIDALAALALIEAPKQENARERIYDEP